MREGAAMRSGPEEDSPGLVACLRETSSRYFRHRDHILFSLTRPEDTVLSSADPDTLPAHQNTSFKLTRRPKRSAQSSSVSKTLLQDSRTHASWHGGYRRQLVPGVSAHEVAGLRCRQQVTIQVGLVAYLTRTTLSVEVLVHLSHDHTYIC
jgi:hypothetical protein